LIKEEQSGAGRAADF